MKFRFRLPFLLLAGTGLGTLLLSGCSQPPEKGPEPEATAGGIKDAPEGKKTGGDKKTGPAVERFTNFKAYRKGALKDNYVDFSLDIPETWEVKPESNDPNSRNFIKIERSLKDHDKGEFTLENFAAGSLKLKTPKARTPQGLSTLAALYSKQMATRWLDYKEISRGPVKIGNYPGYEVRFEKKSPDTSRGAVTLWGRIVLLPHPKSPNGLALFMTASSLDKNIRSAADVGKKGELPIILKSFKFG